MVLGDMCLFSKYCVTEGTYIFRQRTNVKVSKIKPLPILSHSTKVLGTKSFVIRLHLPSQVVELQDELWISLVYMRVNINFEENV